MKFEDVAQGYGNFYSPRYQILVEEEDVLTDHFMEVLNVSFEESIDGFQRFSFAVSDPQSKWLDKGIFKPGKIIKIKLGYVDQLTTMTVGEIISLSSSFPSSGTPQLEVSGYDLSYQLTRANQNRTWPKDGVSGVRASDVVKELLDAPVVKHKLKSTITQTDILPTIVQNGQTHYKFIKKLAEENFFDFHIKEDKAYFGPAEENVEVAELKYGNSLLSFNPELNTAKQVSSVTVIGYDPKTKKAIIGKAAKKPGKNGKSGAAATEQFFGNVELKVTNRHIANQQQAKTLAQSILEKSSVGLVRGNATSIGIPEIRAGATIKLSKLGKTFSQKYFIEKAKHSISTSGYNTSFNVRGDFS
jgi:phage protein D